MMAERFAFRAVQADGRLGSGVIEAASVAAAIASLRGRGARPIEVNPAPRSSQSRPVRHDAATRAATVKFIGQLAVLAEAGLPLDRSLALAIANVEAVPLANALADLLGEVREGLPLSQAIARRPEIFPAAAAAMAEAGEANGAIGPALARIAAMMERAEQLRRTVAGAAIYPIVLALLAVGVIALMLLFVVPRFEGLFAQEQDRLPAASRLVMAASHLLREQGLWLAGGLGLGGLALSRLVARPGVAAARDRLVLRLPTIGALVRHIECARFARTLGVLVEGEVALPYALALASRAIGNRTMAGAVAAVSGAVREGAGLAGPLAQSGVLPPMALGFLRTGEETSRLGPMLVKLADVLDADVEVMLQRLIAIATPLLTIMLGAAVAAIIAAIMSAIIGFNELAISS